MNGFYSDPGRIECSVPQRSVLGPLHFLIFINDPNFAIWNSSTFHFVDDTSPLNIKSTKKELTNMWIKFLGLFQNRWMLRKFCLNITKTDVLIFRVFETNLKLKLYGKKLFTSNFSPFICLHCMGSKYQI